MARPLQSSINADLSAVSKANAEVGRAVVGGDTGFGRDDDTSIPAELRNWLVHLRLLEGVPFANLVADSALLPPESIRWFYLDRRWTDAVVQGALSVGTVNSDDREILALNYPAVRAELDHEERNVRVGGRIERRQGEAGPISGFLLRSEAVSGWPGLHVRAFDVEPEEGDGGSYADTPEGDPRRIRLLRLERLAPAVLLCLFDGVPRVVHIEEPRQGIQFGFLASNDDGRVTSTVEVRSVTTGRSVNEPPDPADRPDPPVEPVTVPFRGGRSGVVDIRRLGERLADVPQSGLGSHNRLDSDEYALQLIRFPWRQVFGDVEDDEVVDVFRPTIDYEAKVREFEPIVVVESGGIVGPGLGADQP